MKRNRNISRLKVPHNKHTAAMASVQIAPPAEVLLPMQMHSGQAAVPVVSVGDQVRIGQLIAREEGPISSPVYATISGTVSAIEPYEAGGRKTQAIRIAGDGKMEKDPAIAAPQVSNLDEFLAAVQKSGIVGLGGAAFPLWKKLDAVRRNKIKTVLVNGAECEPYITSDTRTMLEHSDMIVKGVSLLRRYLQAEEFVIGIEENKPEAIAEMKRVFAGDNSVRVLELDCVYPQGAKQALLYNATGLVVEAGQRLASLGVIIINITSLAKMAQYMEDGMPLVEKCVTVDGSAVKNPGNYLAPIGTSVGYLIEQAGGLKEPAGKILLGGPMMGATVKSVDEPIIKATNAVLAFNQADSVVTPASACLRCGRCVEYCPLRLNPQAFDRAMEIENEDQRYATLEALDIRVCMECGCCAYVCPAHRPLVQTNREAMQFVRKYKAAHAEKKEGGK